LFTNLVKAGSDVQGFGAAIRAQHRSEKRRQTSEHEQAMHDALVRPRLIAPWRRHCSLSIRHKWRFGFLERELEMHALVNHPLGKA
jgi:hypothetical protein